MIYEFCSLGSTYFSMIIELRFSFSVTTQSHTIGGLQFFKNFEFEKPKICYNWPILKPNLFAFYFPLIPLPNGGTPPQPRHPSLPLRWPAVVAIFHRKEHHRSPSPMRSDRHCLPRTSRQPPTTRAQALTCREETGQH